MRDISIVKGNIRKMIDAGAPESDIDKYIVSEGHSLEGLKKTKEPADRKIGKTEAAIIGAGKGYSFGFGDELVAAAATPTIYAGSRIAEAFGGDTKGLADQTLKETYKQERDKGRAEISEAEKQQPGAFLAGEVSGGIASPIARGAAGLKGGAKIGAITGAGYSEADTDAGLVADTIVGTATGAIGGKVLDKVGGAVAGVKNSISSLVKRFAEERTGQDILGSAIKPGQAKTLANKLAGKEGRQVLLPDVAGDDLVGFTRLLAKTPGSKNTIHRALSDRTAHSATRVSNLVNKGISNDAYFGSLDNLIEARSTLSGPLYEKAYKEGFDLKGVLVEKGDKVTLGSVKELIDDERVFTAINRARKDFGIKTPDTSVETLHGARQVVDDIINQAEGQSKNNMARSYRELKAKINKVLYQASPTLELADNTFAGYKALENAQELGAKFRLLRPEQLKKTFSELTSGEQDAFRIGAKENLMKMIGQSTDRVSVARKIFAIPDNRRRLKVIFKDEKQYNDFAKRMLDEIKLFNTKEKVLGGSRTDINIADEAAIIDKFSSGASSPKLAVLRAVTDSVKKRYVGLNEANAKEVAEILVSPEKSIQALNNIYKKSKLNEASKKATKDAVEDIISRMGVLKGGIVAQAGE
jgi:hypothetical protein